MSKCDSETVEFWAGGHGKEWGKAVAQLGTSSKSMLANEGMPVHRRPCSQAEISQLSHPQPW